MAGLAHEKREGAFLEMSLESDLLVYGALCCTRGFLVCPNLRQRCQFG